MIRSRQQGGTPCSISTAWSSSSKSPQLHIINYYTTVTGWQTLSPTRPPPTLRHPCSNHNIQAQTSKQQNSACLPKWSSCCKIDHLTIGTYHSIIRATPYKQAQQRSQLHHHNTSPYLLLPFGYQHSYTPWVTNSTSPLWIPTSKPPRPCTQIHSFFFLDKQGPNASILALIQRKENLIHYFVF